MLENEFFKELSDRLSRLVPAAEEIRIEARTKIEQALKKALSDLNVLTQEEFDVQSRALLKAEQRIAELEKALSELERGIKQGSDTE